MILNLFLVRSLLWFVHCRESHYRNERKHLTIVWRIRKMSVSNASTSKPACAAAAISWRLHSQRAADGDLSEQTRENVDHREVASGKNQGSCNFKMVSSLRASSGGVSRAMPSTRVLARRTVRSTERAATAASTAVCRSVWPWACPETVRRQHALCPAETSGCCPAEGRVASGKVSLQGSGFMSEFVSGGSVNNNSRRHTLLLRVRWFSVG